MMLLDLFEELLEEVFEYINVEDLNSLSVCSRSYSLLCQPYLWKSVKISPIDHLYLERDKYKDLLENGEELFQHTASLKMTDTDFRVGYILNEFLDNIIPNMTILLAKCKNLLVLHTDLILPKSVDFFHQSKLQEVTLSCNAANDHCLNVLCNAHPLVRSLTVEETDDDTTLSAILNGVGYLDYNYFGRITPLGLSSLVRLPHLAVLRLYGCSAVDDDCVKWITSLGSVKELALVRCLRITMRCLNHLSTMQLERLDIVECRRLLDKHMIEIKNMLAHVKHLNFQPAQKNIFDY